MTKEQSTTWLRNLMRKIFKPKCCGNCKVGCLKVMREMKNG